MIIYDDILWSAFQIENEYGSYFACDYDYLRYLREKALAYLGQEVILITTDGSGDGYLKCGNLEGVYATVDFGVTSKFFPLFIQQSSIVFACFIILHIIHSFLTRIISKS